MSWKDVIAFVAQRARNRCEYCRMHQALQSGTFHVDHYIPISRGGTDDLANLCWSCTRCNQRKYTRVEIPDLESDRVLPIFNPRNQIWSDHFAWIGYELFGLTPLGRAMVEYFEWNHEKRLLLRRVESQNGLFPPSDV